MKITNKITIGICPALDTITSAPIGALESNFPPFNNIMTDRLTDQPIN